MSSDEYSNVVNTASSRAPISRIGLLLRLIFGLLFSGTIVPVALAQVSTSSVSGFVTDTSGASVPGAKVTIREVRTGLARTTTTSDSGQYSILAIPAGVYNFRVERPGFETIERTGQAITQQFAARVDFVLKVGT